MVTKATRRSTKYTKNKIKYRALEPETGTWSSKSPRPPGVFVLKKASMVMTDTGKTPGNQEFRISINRYMATLNLFPPIKTL